MSTRGARYAAKLCGEKTYNTSTPCKRGHIGPRMTTTGSCIACVRLMDYERTANNRPAYNERKRQERQHKLAAIAEQARAARAAESADQRADRLEGSRERSKLWRLANPRHLGTLEAKHKYARSVQGRAAARRNCAYRRAAFLHRVPLWLTADDRWFISEIYHLAKVRSVATGIPWHVDHAIPLQGRHVSGLHVPSNLRVVTKADNLSKGNKYEVPK